MNERLHAIWVLITAPFPLFLIALIVGAVVIDHLHTKRRSN